MSAAKHFAVSRHLAVQEIRYATLSIKEILKELHISYAHTQKGNSSRAALTQWEFARIAWRADKDWSE